MASFLDDNGALNDKVIQGIDEQGPSAKFVANSLKSTKRDVQAEKQRAGNPKLIGSLTTVIDKLINLADKDKLQAIAPVISESQEDDAAADAAPEEAK